MLAPEQKPQLIEHLLPYSNYSITVVAVNEKGKGHVLETTNATLEEGTFYCISSVIGWSLFFFNPKQSLKSRSILQDGSGYLGLLRKGNTRTCIIAKLHGTDLVICSHSRERKILSYSGINMVSCLYKSTGSYC